MAQILDKQTINREINRMLSAESFDGESIYHLTQSQVDKIEPLFRRIMSEERNKNLSTKEQISAIDDIIEGFAVNETEERIFRDNSDNKHMAYFDEWLGEGESNTIIDILNEYELGTDVLRGLQLKNFNPLRSPINPDVEIYQEISTDGDTSLEVAVFEIYYKGKLIYSFDKEIGTEVFHNEKPKPAISEEFKSAKSTYSGKIDINGTIGNVFTDKNGSMSVRYPKGTVIDGVNVGGRFIKGANLFL